jgi:hypothetical protein
MSNIFAVMENITRIKSSKTINVLQLSPALNHGPVVNKTFPNQFLIGETTMLASSG